MRLQAVGLTAGQAEAALAAFGNAIAAAGGTSEQLDRVSLALTQINSKGTVSAEEINQIAEAVPQVRAAMEAAFGTSSAELIESLGITAEQFVNRLTTEMAKIPRVASGASNAIENIDQALFKVRATIGDALLPVLIDMAEWFDKNEEAVKTFAKTSANAIGDVVRVFDDLGEPLANATTDVRDFATGVGEVKRQVDFLVGILPGCGGGA